MTRETAIEQLEYCIELIKSTGIEWLDERDIPMLNMAIEALSKMKTGRVETASDGNPLRPTVWAVCSECKKPIDLWDNYCRSCGAKMEGERHDE